MALHNTTLRQAIEDYLGERRGDWAYNTWTSRKSTLGMFHKTVTTGSGASRELLVRSVDVGHIRKFKAERSDMEPSTRNLTLVALTDFFKWCETNGYVKSYVSLLAVWRRVKEPRKEKFRLNEEQIMKMIEGCEHPRDRALLATYTFSLARGISVRAIRIRDIQWHQDGTTPPCVRIRDIKTGDYTHYIPMDPWTKKELIRWLEFYRENVPAHMLVNGELDPDWYLIPAKESPRFGPEGRFGPRVHGALKPTTPMIHPYNIVQRELRKHGLPTRRQGGHTFRRSMARIQFLYIITDPVTSEYRDELVFDAASLIMAQTNHKDVKTFLDYIGWEGQRARRDAMWSKATSPFDPLGLRANQAPPPEVPQLDEWRARAQGRA